MEATDLSRSPIAHRGSPPGRLVRAAEPLRFAPGDPVAPITGRPVAGGAGAGERRPRPDRLRPVTRLGSFVAWLLATVEAIPSIAGHPDYLTAADAAELLQITPASLDTLRHRGEGPPGVRLGRRGLRFHRRDVEEWQRARRPAGPAVGVPSGKCRGRASGT